MMPFIEPVNLGVLDVGTYDVSYKGNPDIKAQISVAKRVTEAPDDFLYAPVDNGWVESESGRQTVTIQGTFPHWYNGCQIMKEVRVNSGQETVVVQPITEIVDDERCDDDNYKFDFKVTKEITSPLENKGVLHVRTLNSHAINRFIPTPL